MVITCNKYGNSFHTLECNPGLAGLERDEGKTFWISPRPGSKPPSIWGSPYGKPHICPMVITCHHMSSHVITCHHMSSPSTSISTRASWLFWWSAFCVSDVSSWVYLKEIVGPRKQWCNLKIEDFWDFRYLCPPLFWLWANSCHHSSNQTVTVEESRWWSTQGRDNCASHWMEGGNVQQDESMDQHWSGRCAGFQRSPELFCRTLFFRSVFFQWGGALHGVSRLDLLNLTQSYPANVRFWAGNSSQGSLLCHQPTIWQDYCRWHVGRSPGEYEQSLDLLALHQHHFWTHYSGAHHLTPHPYFFFRERCRWLPLLREIESQWCQGFAKKCSPLADVYFTNLLGMMIVVFFCTQCVNADPT